MSASNTWIGAAQRGRRSRRRARRGCRSTDSAGRERSASNDDGSRSGADIGEASNRRIKDGPSYNRYAILFLTREATDTQSEKRALAPLESSSSELELLTPSAENTNARLVGEAQLAQQPETAAPPVPSVCAVPHQEPTNSSVDANPMMDLVKRITPTSMVLPQSQFSFTCPMPNLSPRVSDTPSLDLTIPSKTKLYMDQTSALIQINCQLSGNSPRFIQSTLTSASPTSAATPRNHLNHPDVALALEPSTVKQPTNNTTTLAVQPISYQKRGWPSPTNSPPAPTTRDRKSRFFPTSPTSSGTTSQSTPPTYAHSRSPYFSPPPNSDPPNPIIISFPKKTIPPIIITKQPKNKRAPPPPIKTTYSPLHSPILVRSPPPLEILTLGNGKKSPAALLRPTRTEMEIQPLLRIEWEKGGEDDEEVEEIGMEELGTWERDLERELEGWVGGDRGFWGRW